MGWIGSRRPKHFAAMVLIGDGVMAMIQPRRDAKAWAKGPRLWCRSMEWLAEHPTVTRAIGATEVLGGVLWALSQEED
jgi:hypothetical protein